MSFSPCSLSGMFRHCSFFSAFSPLRHYGEYSVDNHYFCWYVEVTVAPCAAHDIKQQGLENNRLWIVYSFEVLGLLPDIAWGLYRKMLHYPRVDIMNAC